MFPFVVIGVRRSVVPLDEVLVSLPEPLVVVVVWAVLCYGGVAEGVRFPLNLELRREAPPQSSGYGGGTR